MNNFQGDPKIFLDENGSYLKFKNGQPVMDKGLENMALISLFTKPGWIGNLFLQEDSQIGSDFQETSSKTITVSSLEDIRRAAEKAIDNQAFGEKDITITNPNSYRINATIKINPPGEDAGVITVSKNGENWINQKLEPAYKG